MPKLHYLKYGKYGSSTSRINMVSNYDVLIFTVNVVNNADRMTNSSDPDQTSLGDLVCTVSSGMSVQMV